MQDPYQDVCTGEGVGQGIMVLPQRFARIKKADLSKVVDGTLSLKLGDKDEGEFPCMVNGKVLKTVFLLLVFVPATTTTILASPAGYGRRLSATTTSGTVAADPLQQAAVLYRAGRITRAIQILNAGLKNGTVKDIARGYFHLGVLYWALRKKAHECRCFMKCALYNPYYKADRSRYARSVIMTFDNERKQVLPGLITKAIEQGKQALEQNKTLDAVLAFHQADKLGGVKEVDAYITAVHNRVANLEQQGMVYIPAGWFWMGCSPKDAQCSNDETPYHKVYLNAYYIDKTDVTARAYSTCVNAGACTPPDSGYNCNGGVAGRAEYPANCVDWNQARAYCTWAGKDLPTEAQWEKAAKGTDGRVYPWGNDWDESKVCFNTSSTCPVGQHQNGASPYGVLDMSGNVWNWCSDWYHSSYYRNSPDHNPQGPDTGMYRVLKGGSWNYFNFDSMYLRSSFRYYDAPYIRRSSIGFRCVEQ